MYERNHVQKLTDLISVNPHMHMIALTGPRQAGKTTIALQACTRFAKSGIPSWYFASDDPGPAQSYQGKWAAHDHIRMGGLSDGQSLVDLWENARKVSLQSDRGLVLFLDEIHMIPNWSRLVKGLWDRDRREGHLIHAVILGSAAWKMLTGTGESLTGRFRTLPVTHWSFPEMAQVFGLTLDEYIFFGGYPGALTKELDPARLQNWHNYVTNAILRPVVDKDIAGLERVRKPELMRQLIELAPHYSSQLISYNKLLGQLQDAGNTTTIARYLDLLSDAYIMTALSRYTPSPHVGKASPPKLNVLNTALMTVSSRYTFEGAKADRSFWGRVIESSVGAHLLNTRGSITEIYFWRNPPYEVDYVISHDRNLVGVEVKSGKTRTRKGLVAFKERFPHAKTLMLGPNNIPLNEFFSFTTDEWLEQL